MLRLTAVSLVIAQQQEKDIDARAFWSDPGQRAALVCASTEGPLGEFRATYSVTRRTQLLQGGGQPPRNSIDAYELHVAARRGKYVYYENQNRFEGNVVAGVQLNLQRTWYWRGEYIHISEPWDEPNGKSIVIARHDKPPQRGRTRWDECLHGRIPAHLLSATPVSAKEVGKRVEVSFERDGALTTLVLDGTHDWLVREIREYRDSGALWQQMRHSKYASFLGVKYPCYTEHSYYSPEGDSRFHYVLLEFDGNPALPQEPPTPVVNSGSQVHDSRHARTKQDHVIQYLAEGRPVPIDESTARELTRRADFGLAPASGDRSRSKFLHPVAAAGIATVLCTVYLMVVCFIKQRRRVPRC